MKTFELCNWGQDIYTEDNPDKSFNDIMDDIKTKVISDLQAKILSEYTHKSRELDTKQIIIIRSDAELLDKVIDTLQFTAMTKEEAKKAIVLAKRGESVPSRKPVPISADPESVAGPESVEDLESAVAAGAARPVPLNPEAINKKIMNILKTFINTLVIKSTEPFYKTINLSALLNKYEIDKKKSVWPVRCECSSSNNCKKQHDNLYEAVVCELKVYAKSIVENKNNPKYNEEIHINIMNLLDEIFKNSTLLIDWNIYAETLLKEINNSKIEKSRTLGRFNTTHKKSRR
jgi:hypothetical protein